MAMSVYFKMKNIYNHSAETIYPYFDQFMNKIITKERRLLYHTAEPYLENYFDAIESHGIERPSIFPTSTPGKQKTLKKIMRRFGLKNLKVKNKKNKKDPHHQGKFNKIKKVVDIFD
jgi:hypothetical protein